MRVRAAPPRDLGVVQESFPLPVITYGSQSFELLPGETVLRGLRRQGHAIPSSCEAGACQSCLMRTVEGNPPAASQQGLKDALKHQGYFLSCLARPDQDLEVAMPGETMQLPVTVTGLHKLSSDVLCVRMKVEGERAFSYEPGQFLNLVRADGLMRPYSVASLPGRDDFLELHVRRAPHGQMSNWMHDVLQAGDRLSIRGPAGDCFYVPGEPDSPILLVGTGTGLAPLYAIVQDALRREHRGPLVLMHGALHEDGFYLVEELTDLARRHPNLHYTRCMPEGQPGPGLEIGPIETLACRQLAAISERRAGDWRFYLCGNPTLVHGLRKKLFLSGASLKRIHSDAFVSAAPAK